MDAPLNQQCSTVCTLAYVVFWEWGRPQDFSCHMWPRQLGCLKKCMHDIHIYIYIFMYGSCMSLVRNKPNLPSHHINFGCELENALQTGLTFRRTTCGGAHRGQSPIRSREGEGEGDEQSVKASWALLDLVFGAKRTRDHSFPFSHGRSGPSLPPSITLWLNRVSPALGKTNYAKIRSIRCINLIHSL